MSAPGGNELVVLNKAFDRSVLPIQYSTCFDFRVLALLGTLIYIYISAYIYALQVTIALLDTSNQPTANHRHFPTLHKIRRILKHLETLHGSVGLHMNPVSRIAHVL